MNASRRRLLLVVPAVLVIVAVLLYAGGMRLEMAGSGTPYFVTFTSADKQAERIEADRAASAAAPVAPQAVAPEVMQAAVAAPAAPDAPAAEPASKTVAVRAAWPDYRGADRDGVSKESILTSWPGGRLKELWRKPVGGGWASVVVAGPLAYTIEQRRAQEVVAAYDVTTGREVWAHKYDAHFQESMGGPGPRATPTWHEGRLYSLGATGELFVLDGATGKVIWHKNILDDNGAQNITWAMSAAPLIVDEKVIVQPGGTSGKSVVAYNKLTGERIWSSLNDRTSYTSPALVTLAGKRQIITATASRVVGLDPATGKLLWEFPWVTEYEINSAQPIITGPASFIISAGYGHGAALVDVSSGAAKAVWENKKLKNKFNSSVFLDGYVYGFDESIFTCVEAKTGEVKWKAGRYGYGQVLLASGHLVITSEDGEVVLLKADPTGHKELAKFQAMDGRTWNVPAIADGRLYVRNATEMVVYQIGK